MTNFIDLCRAELIDRKRHTYDKASRHMEAIINDVRQESNTLAIPERDTMLNQLNVSMTSIQESLEKEEIIMQKGHAETCLKFVESQLDMIKKSIESGKPIDTALEKIVEEDIAKLPATDGYGNRVGRVFATLIDIMKKEPLGTPERMSSRSTARGLSELADIDEPSHTTTRNTSITLTGDTATTEAQPNSQHSFLPGMTPQVQSRAQFLPPISTAPVIAQPEGYYVPAAVPQSIGLNPYGMIPQIAQPQGYLLPQAAMGGLGNTPGNIQRQMYHAVTMVPMMIPQNAAGAMPQQMVAANTAYNQPGYTGLQMAPPTHLPPMEPGTNTARKQGNNGRQHRHHPT